ncbi:PREDICTED: uncharacterized protein LOC104815628 isoform X3 [Tarenaya hassleriana]|uniref:uncharacterized protein LOC104815628 isoform X3 n=1 Tax=Tarenaya hassleriana TaxID=28532 RepID=UPI00053C11F2|nr:PREDICTED: uncharacterized protein LOC104815628 isoform X3 [Tarenaya hassleriana]
MVSGSRTGGSSATGIDEGVRKTIKSIQEVLGNHSDADIYAALKEANMDADETAQRLLLQDTFHEVKRRRDRKKEDAVFDGPASREKPSDDADSEVKFRTQPERNVRRGGYSRGSFSRGTAPRHAFSRNSTAGTNREFRVVRDNRSNLNVDGELKHSSTWSPVSNIDKMPTNVNEKGSAGGSGNQQPSGDRDSVHISDISVNTQSRQPDGDASLPGASKKEHSKEKQTAQDATLPSSNSVVGVYSSSTDPVHVPSPDSRSSPIGAIRREVRGGSFAGKSSESVVKDSSTPAGSFPRAPLRKDGAPQAYRPFSPISKFDKLNQTTGRESVLPSGAAGNRSLVNSHHGNRGSQYVRTQQQAGGHQRAVSQNKEWKPKLNQKSCGNNPGVIGTPKKASAAPADSSINLESEAVKLQDKLSHVNISESQNVIIAEHIRVPETDRCQLTFGSFVLEIDSSRISASGFQEACLPEEHECESARSLQLAPPEASNDGAPCTMPVAILDEQVINSGSGSGSPFSTASEQQFPEQKEDSRTSQNLDEYAGIELLHGNSPTLESKQQQDTHTLQNFSAYDPQAGYDLPYFRPSMDENIRGQGFPSPQEVLNAQNTIPTSTIPMLQQQQAQMAQLYPQVHVSHFPNLMPYRQFLPPVYVPQMPMQGYSGNPAAYVHPSSGNSYVLMPGGSSHLGGNGIKYGIQQFKPVPTGGPMGFGSFNNPNGYPINSPSIVGNAVGLEDSSRMKYKDGSIYVPNPQAESSEIWLQNPRDLTGLQSPPYYNVAGQTPHGAYLSNHTAHPSFDAAAAAAQSSHMQFQGLFHPTQPGAMASPHHMGPGLGGNVGVGVTPSPPVAQAGTYQQPQLGHMNWPTNY